MIRFSQIETKMKSLQRLTLMKKFIMTIKCVMTLPRVIHMVLKVGKVGSPVISLKPISFKKIVLSKMRRVDRDLI